MTKTNLFKNHISKELFKKISDNIGGSHVYINTRKSEKAKERNIFILADFMRGTDYYTLSKKYNLELSTIYGIVREYRDMEIAKEYRAGVSYRELLRKYGVRPSHLDKIIDNMKGGVSNER